MEELSERCSIAGFEGRERESQAREYRQPLETGNGEKTDSSLKPLESSTSLPTP